MNNYTRTPRASRRSKKAGLRRTLLVVCMMLVVMVGSIAGTVAWLTASTTPVVNTFTAADIEITLAESTGTEYQLVPGKVHEKDPKVSVNTAKTDVDIYVFVQVDEVNPLLDGKKTLEYAIDTNNWTQLAGTTNVWYREWTVGQTPSEWNVLKDNQVTVSTAVTKDNMETADTAELKFTAYAIQKDNTGTAAEAWALIAK